MESSIPDVIVLDAEADMQGLEAELLADTRLNFSRDEAAALCTTLYVPSHRVTSRRACSRIDFTSVTCACTRNSKLTWWTNSSVLQRNSIPALRFAPHYLTVLPSPPPPSAADALPSKQTLDFLSELVVASRDAASGLITSSLVAGRRSEAEDHGDVAFWVGECDEASVPECILEKLNITSTEEVRFSRLLSFPRMHMHPSIPIENSISTTSRWHILDLVNREPRRPAPHIAQHDKPTRTKRRLTNSITHPRPSLQTR